MANDQNGTLSETTKLVMPDHIGNVKLDELLKLKDSTRKLLCVLEELQSKTHSKAVVTDDLPRLTDVLKPMELLRETSNEPHTIKDVIGDNAIKMLEYQAKALDCIIIEEEDDCSVYKKLTRKCHCLSRKEYNDFVIHFNEDTKFCTGAVGEIIKNMKIVKKFLYMGTCYTNNALQFLNEGLKTNTRHENTNVLYAISFADVCCVFDEQTIVSFCIGRPGKGEASSIASMQDLAASFLCNLAQTEEGRRYMNLNSRITCDIKKVLKKCSSKLDIVVVEALKSILETCQMAAAHPNTITYQCHPAEEDIGNRVLNSLIAFRQYMSTGEVFACLEEVLETSKTVKGRQQLTSQLPTILNLFKSMLLEYDDGSMNIVVTNIMNHLMDKSPTEPDEGEKATSVVNTSTEPVGMRNAVVQSPEKKNSTKKNNKDKSKVFTSKTCSARQNAKGEPPPREHDKEFKNVKDVRSLNRSNRFIRGEPPPREHDKEFKNVKNVRSLNRSNRFIRDPSTSVIVVPIDEEK